MGPKFEITVSLKWRYLSGRFYIYVIIYFVIIPDRGPVLSKHVEFT
jgi:hypothetical protein